MAGSLGDTLTSFFAAYDNPSVTAGSVSVELNAACVHQCLPVCTRSGMAHDLRQCLVTCRDRCITERQDEATHPQYPDHTEGGVPLVHVASVIAVLLSLAAAYIVLKRSYGIPITTRVRHVLGVRKTTRFE